MIPMDLNSTLGSLTAILVTLGGLVLVICLLILGIAAMLSSLKNGDIRGTLGKFAGVVIGGIAVGAASAIAGLITWTAGQIK